MTPSLDLNFSILKAGLHVFKKLNVRNYTSNPLIFIILLNKQFNQLREPECSIRSKDFP